MIDVIILAGGFGKRLQPLIADLPKPLAHINGKPFLDILLESFPPYRQIAKVVLAVGYKAEVIRAHYSQASRFPFEILFSQEEKPLGTGGAARQAMSLTTSKDVLVMNGDAYIHIDLSLFHLFHEEQNRRLSIALAPVDDIRRYGHVEWDDKTRNITSFCEKSDVQKPGFINAGRYLMRRDLLSSFEEGSPFSLEYDVFPKMIAEGISAFPIDGKFIDIGTVESYQSAPDFFKEISS